MRKSSTKLTLTLTGVVDDVLKTIPNGEKAALINGVMAESIKNGTIYASIYSIFGISEGTRIKKKVEKLLSGIELPSETILNGNIKASTSGVGISEEKTEISDIIDHQESIFKDEESFFPTSQSNGSVVKNENVGLSVTPKAPADTGEFGFFKN